MSPTQASVRSSADLARRAAFRPILVLLAAFLAVSTAMIAVIVSLAAVGVSLDSPVWIRCSLVFGSSIVLLLIAFRAAKGSRAALTRIRIIAPVVVVAVAVIVSIPGFLPGWVRIEQTACGLLVLPVAIMVNLSRTRQHFLPSEEESAAEA